MTIYDYNEGQIAAIIICGSLLFGLFVCMGMCGVLYGMKHVHRERKNKVRRSSSNGHHSSGVLIKEQSQSVLRGEHPIAFVLPTVSLSQTETESEFSEMDSMVYSSSTSVMSQIAYHQICQDQLQPQHQSLSMEEQSDIERGSSARLSLSPSVHRNMLKASTPKGFLSSTPRGLSSYSPARSTHPYRRPPRALRRISSTASSASNYQRLLDQEEIAEMMRREGKRDYNVDGYESEYGYPLTSLPDSRHLIPTKGATIWSQGHPYSRIQSSDASKGSPTHLKRQKYRRKLGYLPMTTITSLDIPTEDELLGASNHERTDTSRDIIYNATEVPQESQYEKPYSYSKSRKPQSSNTATTHKTPTVKAQPPKPNQPNSKTSAKGFKTSSPVLRKQTYSKQPYLASSKSQEEKLSDTFYEDSEETALLGKIIFNLELDQQEEHAEVDDQDSKVYFKLKISNMKFVANRHSYLPDGRISLRITVLPELEVRRDTLTAPMEGLQATFLDRIGLNDLKLTDEVLKFTVINRGGRKSIQSYKSKFSSKPSRHHGFAIFVLSQLPIQENASLLQIRDISRSSISLRSEQKQELNRSSKKENSSEQQGEENSNEIDTTISRDKEGGRMDTSIKSGKDSPSKTDTDLLSDDSAKPLHLLQRKFEINVFSSISNELAKAYSNTLVLGLHYEPETEKLSLKIVRASIASSSLHKNQASYYGKVTLFEGHKVVKAKKTSPVSAFSVEHENGDMISKFNTEPSTNTSNKGKEDQDNMGKLNQDPEFEETFCILFPPQYLDHVSCIVSLCGKTKTGAKINFGRAYIGSHEHPSQSGFKHWEEMAANPNTFIIRTHFLDNHPDFSANK